MELVSPHLDHNHHKGARGFRKGEHWGSALEYHDQHYKITKNDDYIKFYHSMPKAQLTTSSRHAQLRIFESSWRGLGRSPLTPANHVFHEKGRIATD